MKRIFILGFLSRLTHNYFEIERTTSFIIHAHKADKFSDTFNFVVYFNYMHETITIMKKFALVF